MLKEVAKRIKFSIRSSDLAFRYGGEEFAAILPSPDLPTGQQVAERVRQMVANDPFLVESLSLHITISVGVSTCPGNVSTAQISSSLPIKLFMRQNIPGRIEL